MPRQDVYGDFDESGRLIALTDQAGEPLVFQASGAPGDFKGVVVSDASTRALGDYLATGTAAIAQDATIQRSGPRTVRLNVAQGTGQVLMVHAISPANMLDRKGRVGAWVYVQDYTKINQMTLKVSLGDSSFTNGVFQSYSMADGDKQFNGWHFVSFAGAEFGGTWGAPNFETQAVAAVALEVQAGAGGAVLYLDSFVVGWRSVARLMITQDDGYAAWFSQGLPVLEAFGLRATMSIIAALVGTAPQWVTSAQLRQAYARGHDLCPHGQNALNTLPTDDARRADIQFNVKYLEGLGLTRALKYYVYPNGVYQTAPGNQGIINALKSLGIRAARGTTSPRTTKIGAGLGDNRYLLPIIGDDAATSFDTIKARLDAAVLNGDLCHLMYHDLAQSGAAGITVNVDKLARVCEYVAELQALGKLRVITASQLLAEV